MFECVKTNRQSDRVEDTLELIVLDLLCIILQVALNKVKIMEFGL